MMDQINTKAASGLREACGVFGIYEQPGKQVAKDIYFGLCALQHRGQEACGIAISDTDGPRDNISSHKNTGLVTDVFGHEELISLPGNLGIGHVRYSTTGENNRENAQPLVLSYIKGTMALAHNGNLLNVRELHQELAHDGAIFHTTTDSELIAYLIARARVNTGSIEEAVAKTAAKLRGGYALLIKSPRKIIAMRDPLGLKPLCLGKRDHAWIVASESCAIESVGGRFVRDIAPGEIVTITSEGVLSNRACCQENHAKCVFEYIYFARLDSVIDGIHVYNARICAGELLAKDFPADADIVAGVPNSGLAAARGYAKAAGLPFEMIFYRNSYVGRTFIKPVQEDRTNGVKMKLSVLKPVVQGKRIILVDDSIVRGTTITGLIRMLKKAGAKEVHVRISAPPFLYPCYYGTDVPSNKQLIASSHSTEQIRKMIGADSLAYLKIEHLPQMTGQCDLCMACFNGIYPV